MGRFQRLRPRGQHRRDPPMSNRSSTITTSDVLVGLVQETRPRQWYKQGVLLIGLIFSYNLFEPVAVGYVFAAMAAFTGAAGATYIFNDINDVEEDRKHPRKRYRPIASGQVPVTVAAAFAVGLLVASLSLAYTIRPLLAIVVLAYLGQNALYSTYLKDLAHVDVLIVAIGFVLRAIAGVVAIDVYLSPWLIVCTFLLALLLALGKRRHEFVTLENAAETRDTLGNYSKEELDQLLVITTATLLMAYALYTFFRGDRLMMFSLPFAVYGVFRYHHLVHSDDVTGQPENIFTDPPMLANAVCWTIVTIIALYVIPTFFPEVVA